MKTITVIDHFGVKANCIGSDCALHGSLERHPVSSVNLEATHRQRGIGRRGSSRLLDLLMLTT